ncbi:MAG: hypothetical protein KAI40_03560 [Desulfobacterales bacterium]|nr:hypothetical protein [Desulfobacterales bacterium]
MKISNPETIEESEKEFIDMINAELDWEAIENLLLEKHNFTLQEEVEYKNGDMIVHKNSIAYKFDFNIKVPLSIIFNRKGEFLELLTSQSEESEDDDEINIDMVKESLKEKGKKPELAADIADMISEINQED